MVRGGERYAIITDNVGSPIMVVRESDGFIAQRRSYDAWGNVLEDTNPGFQPFGFAGGLYDGATGLIRYGARDYDPAIGRWTNKDPIRFTGGDLNLYAYAGLDPINRIDPTGLGGDELCERGCDKGKLCKKICEKIVDCACSIGIKAGKLCCKFDQRHCIAKCALLDGDYFACTAKCDAEAAICIVRP